MWTVPAKVGRINRGLLLMAFLWVGMIFVPAGGVFGQAPDECDDLAALYEIERVVITLDNIGIGRWDFRNPRVPYPFPKDIPPERRPRGLTGAEFVARQARCRAEARKAIEVFFDNNTIDRDFDVEFKFELPLLTNASFESLANLEILRLRQELDPELITAIREALPGALAGRYRAIESGQDSGPELISDLREVKRYLEEVLPGAVQELAAGPEIERKLAALYARRAELERRQETEVVARQKALVDQEIAGAESALEAIAETRREIAEAEGLKELEPRIEQALGAAPQEAAGQEMAFDAAVEKFMEGTSRLSRRSMVPGVSREYREFRGACDGAVLLLREALELPKPQDAEESRRLAASLNLCYERAKAFFDSFSPGRNFDESPLGSNIMRLADLVEEIEKRKPLRFQEVCKRKSDDTLDCKFKLFVPANTSAQLPPGVAAALPEGLVEYQVQFRGEDSVPQYAKGFFATTPNPGEPASRFAWTLIGKAGFAADPDPDSTPDQRAPGKPDDCNLSDPKCDPIEPYSPTFPWEGQTRDRFTGSGLLQVGAFLGNRARAQVDFGFKNGNLGGLDGDGQTKVQEYNFEVFSLTGWGLKMGKYGLATPASSIAVREFGEGFELSYRTFSLGYITKRESRANEPTDKDEDSEVYIFQMRNLSTGNAPLFRSLNTLLLFGEEQKPEAAYEYWTAGGEVFLVQPSGSLASASLSGSMAYYYSERKPKDGPDSGNPGKGSAGLLTVGRSWLGENGTVAQKIDFRAGFGSGDDPETASRDEGYIGETSGFFTGGTFFLGNIAGLVSDANGKKLRPGLSNKSYAGLVYTNKTFSLLEGIAGLLKTGDKVVNKSTTIKLHGFLFDEKVYGSREAGWEAGVEFTMEAPSGVTSSLEFFGFVPGDALETVLEDIPWAIRSSVTVKIF